MKPGKLTQKKRGFSPALIGSAAATAKLLTPNDALQKQGINIFLAGSFRKAIMRKRYFEDAAMRNLCLIEMVELR